MGSGTVSVTVVPAPAAPADAARSRSFSAASRRTCSARSSRVGSVGSLTRFLRTASASGSGHRTGLAPSERASPEPGRRHPPMEMSGADGWPGYAARLPPSDRRSRGTTTPHVPCRQHVGQWRDQTSTRGTLGVTTEVRPVTLKSPFQLPTALARGIRPADGPASVHVRPPGIARTVPGPFVVSPSWTTWRSTAVGWASPPDEREHVRGPPRLGHLRRR